MSYQVLARKWRPRNFEEMVGQEHVVRALSNALDNDRLHHAYLFTGTRGVGKTTLARILAKSLNCEQGVSSTPCGDCEICREVDAGRFADLLEVDAASRTKVDQTLELLENVPFKPIKGRYKVYLIDEVHMFSRSSFNALLKTLEEPPPHVKFLLATTDPQKVPVTVLSRCLQMNLKRLQLDEIRRHFEFVLQQEGIPWDSPALDMLARAADGSMRDGLSILDQAVAFGGGEIREAEVKDMLGVAGQSFLPDLLHKLADNDAPAVLQQIAAMAETAPDFSRMLDDLLLLLHRMALVQAVPGLSDPSWGDVTVIEQLAARIPPEDVQLYYEMALRGQRDLPLAPDPRSGFEMILLRMLVFKPDIGKTTCLASPDRLNVQNPASGQGTSTAPADQATTPSAQLKNWHQCVQQLGLQGMAAQLAGHCVVESWNNGQLVLNLAPEGAALKGSAAVKKLQQALERFLGVPVELIFRVKQVTEETPAQAAARQAKAYRLRVTESLRNDPVVRAVEQELDGEMIEKSIELPKTKQ